MGTIRQHELGQDTVVIADRTLAYQSLWACWINKCIAYCSSVPVSAGYWYFNDAPLSISNSANRTYSTCCCELMMSVKGVGRQFKLPPQSRVTSEMMRGNSVLLTARNVMCQCIGSLSGSPTNKVNRDNCRSWYNKAHKMHRWHIPPYRSFFLLYTINNTSTITAVDTLVNHNCDLVYNSSIQPIYYYCCINMVIPASGFIHKHGTITHPLYSTSWFIWQTTHKEGIIIDTIFII